MGKRRANPPQDEANSSSSSIKTTPNVREKRLKRKRYNSDEYMLDDQDFLAAEKVIESSPTPPSIMPQIIRTPKAAAAQKTTIATTPSTPVVKKITSPIGSGRGRTPKKQTPTPPKKLIKSPVKLLTIPPVKLKTTPTLITTPITPIVPPPVLSTSQLSTPKIDKDSAKKEKKDKKLKRDPKKPKDKDSGTSSEEERWLDAIESGKLEEVDDELKKIKPKDPKFMTARQRAMYEKNTEKEVTNPISQHLMSLPTGYKEKVLTAEAIQKAQLKSAKRKQLADEKREKDKQKTMERLLKKQESKAVKQIKNRVVKAQIPRISYQQTVDSAQISLPEGIDFPLAPQTAKEPPKPVLCSIPNCKNIKRYNCSKTNAPLCSFKCYKNNAEKIKKLIC